MGWFRRLHGAKPWRAIGAWLLACYVSGVLITAGFVVYSSLSAGFNNDTRSVADIVLMAVPGAMLWGVVTGGFVAVLTVLPMLGINGLIRARRWPRPLADLLQGVAMGGGIIQILGMPLFTAGTEGILLTAGFTATGLIAGYVYWRFAGRPRPYDPEPERIAGGHIFD